MDLLQICRQISGDSTAPNDSSVSSESLYSLGNYASPQLESQKPWKDDPQYFKNVLVSSFALTKMAIHADSGGDIEVMGMMIGKVIDNAIVVMDAYALPVVGTETRVNAQAESYEFMSGYLEHLKRCGFRNEHIVGWYHSHPGYGCWLSGIDVDTEKLNQKFQDPYIAVVVDPKKTRLQGSVEIGAFRTLPEGYKSSERSQMMTKVREDKKMDYGAHSEKYYRLGIQVFKSDKDDAILRSMAESYWISELTGLVGDGSDMENVLEKNEELFRQEIEELVSSYPTKVQKLLLSELEKVRFKSWKPKSKKQIMRVYDSEAIPGIFEGVGAHSGANSGNSNKNAKWSDDETWEDSEKDKESISINTSPTITYSERELSRDPHNLVSPKQSATGDIIMANAEDDENFSIDSDASTDNFDSSSNFSFSSGLTKGEGELSRKFKTRGLRSKTLQQRLQQYQRQNQDKRMSKGGLIGDSTKFQAEMKAMATAELRNSLALLVQKELFF